MRELNTCFSGLDVYVAGKRQYHYRTNEILTAYLNLPEKDFAQAEKDYVHLKYIYHKLRLEEHMDYDKSALYTKHAYDAVCTMRRVDKLRRKLPPYDKTRDRYSSQDNHLQGLMDTYDLVFHASCKTCLEVVGRYTDDYNPYHFREYLGSEFIRLLNLRSGDLEQDGDFSKHYKENVEQLTFVFPEKMEGIVFDRNEDYYDASEEKNTSEKAAAAIGFNEGLKALFDDYIPFLRAILRAKYVYAPFLEEYIHIRHAFLSEKETAVQFERFEHYVPKTLKKHEKFLYGEQFSMTYGTTKDDNGEPLLCEEYEFSDISALLYIDFFKGLKNHYLPKKCNGCGKWFLLKHGQYSDYCDRPSPDHPGKTCREAGVRKKYEDKCKNDPVWQAYNRAYKAHYARYMKKKMTQKEFEAWGTFAIKLRDTAAAGILPFEEYAAKIRI